MAEFEWDRVIGSGSGTHEASSYTWGGSQFDWNTGSFLFETCLPDLGGPRTVPGGVPAHGDGSGVGEPQGPEKDNTGLMADENDPRHVSSCITNPVPESPYMFGTRYPVDLLINSGNIDINSFLLDGRDPGISRIPTADVSQRPTVDAEGTISITEGNGLNASPAIFSTSMVSLSILDSAITAETEALLGASIIDIVTGEAVQIASTHTSIAIDFQTAVHEVLNFGSVSSSQRKGFSGTIAGFAKTAEQ